MPKKPGKSKLNYYDTFREQASCAQKETELFIEAIENFSSAEAIKEYLPRAHEIESAADDLHHSVMRAIDVDFITPFDRNDIILLADALESIVDGFEEIMQRTYMYDIHFMHPDLLPMAKLLKETADALAQALNDFENYKKFGHFAKCIDTVNELEEKMDDAYMETMHRLFTDDKENPMRVIAWKGIFDLAEDSCDRMYDTCILMANIILKNS